MRVRDVCITEWRRWTPLWRSLARDCGSAFVTTALVELVVTCGTLTPGAWMLAGTVARRGMRTTALTSRDLGGGNGSAATTSAPALVERTSEVRVMGDAPSTQSLSAP